MKKISWFEHLSPLILAIFPILSLALENIEFIRFSSILRSLFISIVVVLIFYFILYLILKNQNKSAILSGLLIFLCLSYGNAYIYFENLVGENFRHLYLIGFFAILYLLIAVLVINRVNNARELNRAILYGGLAIVVYLLISIGSYEYKVFKSEENSKILGEPLTADLENINDSNLPDIYLILLDGHTRSDILKNVYGFDNSDFINQLEDLGFWVADCSQSNYPGTIFSTKAMFEMEYLHNLYSEDENLVFPTLNNTAVFQILNNNNYSLVTFQNYVFEHFNIQDDIRLERENYQFGNINEFEKIVVDTSILRLLIDLEGVFPDSWLRPFKNDIFLTHYRDTLFALETLPNLPEMDKPLFIFAQILGTHNPFVFMPDGSYNSSETKSSQNYRNAVEFIDTEIPDIVEEILENSDEPPIIILMGDHGATVNARPIEERLSILFAIYFQGDNSGGFYDDISPVNVFRIIFNSLFDLNYEMIPDRSYEIWSTLEIEDTYKRVYPPCDP